jgi:hypothetical protein
VSLLITSLIVGGAVLVALTGVGGSYALWNASAPVQAATLTTGTAALTIDGSAAASLGSLQATRLGPGSSVAQKVTVANTGNVPLTLSLSPTTVTADGGLAPYLLAQVTMNTSDCSVAALGAASRAVSGYSVSTFGVTLQPGASVPACVELTLSPQAPASVQGATASARFTLSGTQAAS